MCCMVALSPFIWNSSTSLGLILCILTWTTPHGLNVTSAIPPFIYSVLPGNQFILLDPDVFFAHSFVVDSFRYPPPSPCRLNFVYLRVHLFFIPSFGSCRLCFGFKMGRQRLCPDSDKKKKKDKKSPKRHSTPDDKKDRGGSTHYKQNIGQFTAAAMASMHR